jgi:flagellar basal-body rod protein FlgB
MFKLEVGCMNVGNISKDQQVYDLLKKGLDASSLRGKVIASNIANINTAGYKRHYVSFEDTLKKSISASEMKTTDSRHIKTTGSAGEITVKQDTSTSMRQDGNNVNIDNEMVNQAANSLMYNALVSQINSRISSTRNVITGGGR